MKKIDKVIKSYHLTFDVFSKYSEPLFALVLRYAVFTQFFWAGWLKVTDIMNGQWSRVVFLFRYEYKVPLLPPEIAAGLATFNEVVFPILILVGLATRFSSLIMFFTALMIELTYQTHLQHLWWMTMTAYLVIRGAGVLSPDYLIRRKYK